MRRCAIALILLTSTLAAAQVPQLLVREGDKTHPVALTNLTLHATIHGYLARTSMTLTFSNDADRVLEGELVFPLPEGATVCSYAINVGNELVDAVTIEKEKARVAFESEVRRGIDPGLVEKVQGNNFRTRIYPIPAKGTRTVRVEYVSDLSSGKDSTLYYDLALQWDRVVPSASITIEVIQSPVDPAPIESKLDNLAFAKFEDRHVAQRLYKDVRLHSSIRVALPRFPASSIAVEKRTRSTLSAENLDPKTAEQFVKTSYYFVASDQAPQAIDRLVKIEKPSRIGLAWDASMSRSQTDKARELAVIEKHLKALGNVRVEVVVFRNVPEGAKPFVIKDGDSGELIKFLKSQVEDGGTALFNVPLVRQNLTPETKPLPPVAYWLVVTDGLVNLGPEMPAVVETPVYAISADPRANHSLLRHLSSSSGGAYLNLQRLTDDQAMAAISASPYSLIAIDYNKDEISDLYPRLPLPAQDRIAIAGKLLGKSATLTLKYGWGNQVTATRQITLSQDQAAPSDIVGRYWAQQKLADLSIMESVNEPEIIALGKEFNLVTSFTSMLVLETTEQYLRHNIVPPKSRAQIYADFMKQIEQRRTLAASTEKAKIDKVLSMWNARIQWWEKEYTYPKGFKFANREDKRLAAGQGGGGGGGRGPGAPATQPAGAITGVPMSEAAPHINSPTPAPRPASPAARESNGDHPMSDRDDVGRGEGRATGGRAIRGGDKDGKGEAAGKALEQASIKIKEWSPDTPYLKALQAAKPEDAYGLYTDQSKTLKSSPAFFLDCADFFLKLKQNDLALRILTNIPELALDDGRLLRIAAHRLQQLKQIDLAIDLFEKVAKLRPEEPQSFRDLALALADRAQARAAAGDVDRARSDYQRCLELLHKVVMNNWQRFEEIEVLALMEANRILAQLQHLSTQHSGLSTLKNPFDPRLIKNLTLGVRITLTWDTDNTDIDLHVVEPSSEVAFYGHNRTTIGGLVSKDFTQGYGPEEYCLKTLMPGEYQIKAHFYGNRDQKLVGPTTVQATIITNFGQPTEKRQSLTLRLKDAKDMVDIGTVTLNP